MLSPPGAHLIVLLQYIMSNINKWVEIRVLAFGTGNVSQINTDICIPLIALYHLFFC